jgi:hypothetical protein
VGHFGVGKIVANLQRYVYCPKMQEDVAQNIRGCILFCTCKSSNRKKCLYHPLHVPTQPRESISMNFEGGFPTTRKGHDYLFLVVDRLSKMCILMPWKNTIKREETSNMFFEYVFAHFWIPRRIISDRLHQISQCFLEYTLGEYGHQVEEIYNFPHTNIWVDKSSQ